MKILILIRGIPGSGKSTLAQSISSRLFVENEYSAGDCEICEADTFFMVNGEYKYIPHLVPAAHTWCQRKAHTAMQEGVKTVIVSNTSVSQHWIEPYLMMAIEFGYQVQQICVFGNFGSIHEVPEQAVQSFREKFRNSLIQELQNGKIP